MNEPFENLLEGYELTEVEDARNALREVTQRIALLGLWRGKFFEHAAFYGGTALRILHGLPRFSEDMDFSLLITQRDFDLGKYMNYLTAELVAFGFAAHIQLRKRGPRSAAESAFVKVNTRDGLIAIGVPDGTVSRTARERLLKIKFEVDTDPPSGARTVTSYMYTPQAFSVRAYDLPSMFAGKMHAALARAWKTRVKGRDWFDLVWFVGKGVPVSLQHLRARLLQTGTVGASSSFGPDTVRELLRARIASLDFGAARADVVPFIKDASQLELWSPEFFYDLTEQLTFA